MKIRVVACVALAILSLCLIAGLCYGQIYTERTLYRPESPDVLYGLMKDALEDMGYTIPKKTENRFPDAIMKGLGFPDSSFQARKDKHTVMLTFKRAQGETVIEIYVSGKEAGIKQSWKKHQAYLEKIRDAVALKFEEIKIVGLDQILTKRSGPEGL